MDSTYEDWLALGALDWSPNTLDRYRRSLLSLPAPDIVRQWRSADFARWLAVLPVGSRYPAFVAVRGLLRWLLVDHPALALRFKRPRSAPGRRLNIGQVRSLLAVHDTMTVLGLRDIAICALMLDSGLRASEICNLRLDWLDVPGRCLDVRIKGGKWGRGVYSSLTGSYLAEWIAVRPALSRADTVFVSLGGVTPGWPLTRGGLGAIVSGWGQKIGLVLSPHDLRRTFASVSTRAGAPSRVLQTAGRWSSLEMVELYTADIEAADFEPWFPVGLAFR